MFVLNFFFNLYNLRLLKTYYCLMELQQYFLYKSCSISHLLYTWKLFFYFSLYKYIFWLEMSTRKYASEYEKLKKKKKLIESQKWSMDKFVISNKQNITQNLNENITNE